MPAVHGSQVPCGVADALGIQDLARPDFGDPVDVEPGASRCPGVRGDAAGDRDGIGPPFAIPHAPGQMFITDARDEQCRVL